MLRESGYGFPAHTSVQLLRAATKRMEEGRNWFGNVFQGFTWQEKNGVFSWGCYSISEKDVFRCLQNT